MQASTGETLFFTDTRAYERDIGRLHAKAKGAQDALANRLRRAGLLPKDAKSGTDIKVAIYVQDHRKKGAPALPEIDGVVVTDKNKKKKN